MKSALDFLRDLSENNTLNWMHQNKARYGEARRAFLGFVQALIAEIAHFDGAVAHLQAEELLFRLNRDTRFSLDKSPYNASFRAHIAPCGKLPVPVGYFVCIRPGASFLGGGLFLDFPQTTARVRDYIAANGDQFLATVNDAEFSSRFAVGGEKLKNVPKGYDSARPWAEYLRFKSWYIEHPIPDGAIESCDVRAMAETFRHMKPFNDYLNAALDGFKMPERP